MTSGGVADHPLDKRDVAELRDDEPLLETGDQLDALQSLCLQLGPDCRYGRARLSLLSLFQKRLTLFPHAQVASGVPCGRACVGQPPDELEHRVHAISHA